jgi:hypothetical protein
MASLTTPFTLNTALYPREPTMEAALNMMFDSAQYENPIVPDLVMSNTFPDGRVHLEMLVSDATKLGDTLPFPYVVGLVRVFALDPVNWPVLREIVTESFSRPILHGTELSAGLGWDEFRSYPLACPTHLGKQGKPRNKCAVFRQRETHLSHSVYLTISSLFDNGDVEGVRQMLVEMSSRYCSKRPRDADCRCMNRVGEEAIDMAYRGQTTEATCPARCMNVEHFMPDPALPQCSSYDELAAAAFRVGVYHYFNEQDALAAAPNVDPHPVPLPVPGAEETSVSTNPAGVSFIGPVDSAWSRGTWEYASFHTAVAMLFILTTCLLGFLIGRMLGLCCIAVASFFYDFNDEERLINKSGGGGALKRTPKESIFDMPPPRYDEAVAAIHRRVEEEQKNTSSKKLGGAQDSSASWTRYFNRYSRLNNEKAMPESIV